MNMNCDIYHLFVWFRGYDFFGMLKNNVFVLAASNALPFSGLCILERDNRAKPTHHFV